MTGVYITEMDGQILVIHKRLLMGVVPHDILKLIRQLNHNFVTRYSHP